MKSLWSVRLSLKRECLRVHSGSGSSLSWRSLTCLARLEKNSMITERYFSNIIEKLPFHWKAKTIALLTVGFFEDQS